MHPSIDWSRLRAAATAVATHAYAPYSGLHVGAAGLVDDGRIVTGTNVENASYGLGLCAECGLVSALHASGGGRLVAVSCVDGGGQPLMPCGRCRQLLWEHGGSECLIDTALGPRPMAELLPSAFDESDLGRAAAPRPAAQRDAVPARLIEYLGRGTVFLHRDVSGGRAVWTGYWERASHADEPAGILEEAPTWSDVT